MKIILLCGVIGILSLIIVLLINKILKSKKIIETLEKNQKKYIKQQKNNEKYKEDITTLSNILNSHICEYNRLIGKKSTKDIRNRINSLERNIREDYNNLNVICNPYDKKTQITKVKTNIIQELRLIKNEYESCYDNLKVNIYVNNVIEEYLKIDNIKLISVLRILINNVIEYGQRNEIDISLTSIEATRKKQRIAISVENVNFSEYNLTPQDINDYFNGKNFDKVDYRLKVLKENILYMGGNAVLDYGRIDNNVKEKHFDIDITLEKNVDEICAIVVDDMKEMAKLNQSVLKEINIKSDIVLSGKECIKRIKENPDKYDIVFTDNQMPEMTGPELLKKLKKLENFDLPVIIVTSDSGLEAEFKKNGFDDYIVKPMSVEEAKEVIKKLI